MNETEGIGLLFCDVDGTIHCWCYEEGDKCCFCGEYPYPLEAEEVNHVDA